MRIGKRKWPSLPEKWENLKFVSIVAAGFMAVIAAASVTVTLSVLAGGRGAEIVALRRDVEILKTEVREWGKGCR